MRKNFSNLTKLNCLLIFFLLTLFLSCNPGKNLKKGKYILERNIIVDENKYFDLSEIEPFLRQKPNRKIAKTIPFHSWLYTQIDQEKLSRKKEKRDKKYDLINEKRIEKQKTRGEKSRKKFNLKDKTKPLFLENILEIGEEPVVLDSFLSNISKEQIQKYVKSKGFFNSIVTQKSITNESKKYLFIPLKRPHAKVIYSISKSNPYTVKSIGYNIKDKKLNEYIKNDSGNCLIKIGMLYDTGVLEKERERILKNQKNNGYYELNPEFLFFSVDSNLKSNQVEITINLKQVALRSEEINDSIQLINHKRFTLNNIYIYTDFNPDPQTTIFNKDTLIYKGVFFLYNQRNKFRVHDIYNKILIHKGDIYSMEAAEATYNKLTDLKVFRTVNINFKPKSKESEELDCFIYLSPVKKQSLTFETEGTNTSGNLGIAGSIVYQNRNVFKGAEILELILSGGLTAQKNLSGSNEITNDLGIPILEAFNTFQFGPEINLYIPKQLFPFSLFKFNKNSAPKTVINNSFNYQKRPEFTRALSNISYGFSFKSGEFIKQQITPIEISFVKANLKSSFQEALLKSNDAFLQNSFIDHITPVSRYTLQYNNQTGKNIQKRNLFTYFKFDFESSGSLLRGAFNLSKRPKDDSGRYTILNVPFSQFLRAYLDLRLYKKIRTQSTIVFRTAMGLGRPLNNLSVLPYEKSFFGGGPNSVRAWKARALGPGSYGQTNDNSFDKIGDSQIEFNLELRFNIYKFLNGAWFVDAGNIWLLKPDLIKPNAHFDLKRFYKEFATGTGFGLRADFQFVILRFDAAFKVYNPKLPENDRWMLNKKPLSTTVINFGIGYPF